MLHLHSNVETGMVIVSVAVILGLGMWLLFREETNGERSLFSKILSLSHDEMEEPASVPLAFTPFQEGSPANSKTPHDQGDEALRKSMRLIPFVQPEELPGKSTCASSLQLEEGNTSGKKD